MVNNEPEYDPKCQHAVKTVVGIASFYYFCRPNRLHVFDDSVDFVDFQLLELVKVANCVN